MILAREECLTPDWAGAFIWGGLQPSKDGFTSRSAHSSELTGQGLLIFSALRPGKAGLQAGSYNFS